MPQLSMSAKLVSVGWSLLSVSVLVHFRVATRSPGQGISSQRISHQRWAASYPDAPAEDLVQQHDVTRQYDAVIVGAGWAGLKAAQTLLDAGVLDILVLEAGDHVGGRSKTINQDGSTNSPSTPVDNVPLELGSEWLDGHTDMDRYLMENDLLDGAAIIDPRAYSGLVKGAKFYERTRHEEGVMYTKEFRHSDEERDEVWERIRSFRRQRLRWLDGEDESWGDTLHAYKRRNALTAKEVKYIDSLHELSRIEYTCDSDEMSLRQNDLLDQRIPSTRYLGQRGLGFGNVASRFSQHFSSKIRLNSRVTVITNYPDSENALVTFENDGKSVKIAARTVLVTVSLGVLKAGAIEFSPGLPRWKQEAIDGMGFGVADKCIMYWNNTDDMVWPEDEFWFELISPEETRWASFFNPSSYKGTPTLTAWVGGRDAAEMEKKTDEDIMNKHVMRNLRSMFPGIRWPDGVVITRWGRDKNVRGTYTYAVTHRNFTRDATSLGARVGRLWFAGEATTYDWHATTIGAWRTGEAAAREIGEFVRGDRGG